jgi:uncharacterized protein (DUF1697 family)
MTTWIALLRGINVGGAKKLAMSDLKALCTSLGHTNVSTYIQSGNVVLTSTRSDRAKIAAEISTGIERTHSLAVSIVLRTPAELRSALAANPFATEAEPTRVTITFLSDVPTADAASLLEPDRFAPDRFTLRGKELYAYYPGGIGRSKMTLDYFEKRLGVRGTARNLNTVAKLIELSAG